MDNLPIVQEVAERSSLFQVVGRGSVRYGMVGFGSDFTVRLGIARSVAAGYGLNNTKTYIYL
jgi:hypothetical protein